MFQAFKPKGISNELSDITQAHVFPSTIDRYTQLKSLQSHKTSESEVGKSDCVFPNVIFQITHALCVVAITIYLPSEIRYLLRLDLYFIGKIMLQKPTC